MSSDDSSMAFPVTGSLPAQLTALNTGPPAYVPGQWAPVHRKDDNSTTAAFRCESVPNPLLQPYLNAPKHPEARDEVTYDNCTSAFYRFQFELPTQYSKPVLVGMANVDDQGVLFLNGNRVTGSMTVPNCDPGPSTSDPCYDLQDTGKDRFDPQSKGILTRGTMDTFAADNPAWFRAGTNELVFAVAGQAEYYKPTGVEFNAQVAFQSDVSAVGDPEQAGVPTALTISVAPVVGQGDMATMVVSLPKSADVDMSMYAVNGRLIKVLHLGRLEAGRNHLTVAMRGAGGGKVASGIYLVRVHAGSSSAVGRIVLVH